MSNLLSLLSFFAASVGAWYAFMAYQSSREISFPRKNAHTKHVEVKHLTKEAKQLHDFIAKNVDRLVYLNILFDSDEFEFHEQNISDKKGIWLNIRFDKIEPSINTEGVELSTMNSCGINLSIDIDDKSDTKVGYTRFGNMLHGYFYIIGYGGPHQGYMGATLRTAVRV